MKRYIKAEIKNGKFISDKQRFKDMVSSMPDGSYLMLLIKQSERSLRENQNYYFTQLGEFGLNYGWTKTDLHELVKNELFVELFDEPISTSDLDEEMWEILFLNLSTFLIIKFENK